MKRIGNIYNQICEMDNLELADRLAAKGKSKRYADDMVILLGDKEYLHDLFREIKQYLYINLKLTVKGNWQVFPVDARGVDFLGYRFYHDYTLLRKSIKKNFARMLITHPTRESIASYSGWAKHCNSKNLIKKLLPC